MMLRASREILRTICCTTVFALLCIQTKFILSDQPSATRLRLWDRHHCKGQDAVDWSRFARKADRLLMYPLSFPVDERDNRTESRLLRRSRDEYNVTLVPVHVQTRDRGDPTWSESFTKLLAFNQTQYHRVLSLDSDVTILQLDPDHRVMTSYLMMIEPSELEFDRIIATIEFSETSDYDMEIVNTIFRDHALILPHRPYTLLTGEFREDIHTRYLGSSHEL
ncbi:hypothetical protein N7494_013304 [Penicillium frequentans]|uniref:Glucose N-acetyltransferase 1 n=1 Tax=Penicillium frequentans TaxID=3151616 RepID=A0AAD6CH63_9EURO|nr:hypothetical protein N7494_013304 [Penicillium glabrum]